jgi:hypothetical protein
VFRTRALVRLDTDENDQDRAALDVLEDQDGDDEMDPEACEDYDEVDPAVEKDDDAIVDEVSKGLDSLTREDMSLSRFALIKVCSLPWYFQF